MITVNRERLGAAYAATVGTFMLGFWAVLYVTGEIPELSTAPYEIGYHLAAELLTALALLAAGAGVLAGRALPARLYPVALGMLLYTVINSAGYYAQLGELPMVGMFTALTVATVLALADSVGGTVASSAVNIATEDTDV